MRGKRRRVASRTPQDGGIARAAAGVEFRAAQAALGLPRTTTPLKLAGDNDTNYIFLSFVTHYLPVGVVGLVIGVIFTAAMSAISGEINSLATVTVIDIYRRHFRPGRDRPALPDGVPHRDRVLGHLRRRFRQPSRKGFGALIEAVNQVGSLFYGGMLGVFVLAFFVKRVGANGSVLRSAWPGKPPSSRRPSSPTSPSSGTT